MRVPNNLPIDSPAWPLLRCQITYVGQTDAVGDAFGTTLVDALCSTAGQQPNYAGQAVKLLSSNAAGQLRPIAVHDLATGTITVAAPWTDFNGAVFQVPASTQFCILSTGGGGGAPPPPPPSPAVGLWMFGMCSPAMVASTTVLLLTNLAGMGDAIFNDEFWCQVIHNASAPSTAPEREIRRITNYVSATGTFTTDAFSANVEAGDFVAIFHETIMAIEIMGFGTLDTDSATVPADSTRAGLYVWENNGYFNGCLLVPTEGLCRQQARRIVGYVAATGVFTLDPNYPFSQAPGLVDYILVGDQCGYSWPYIQALMDIMDSPQVDQNAIEVARLSLHNLRPDGAVIPVGEYAGAVIDIYRYRHGVDAAWTVIVNGAAMVEAAGYASYNYTYPAASWQDADGVMIVTRGCVVTIPPGAAQADFYIPPQMKTTVIGGFPAIIKKLDLIFDIVNSMLVLKETGGSFTADGTEQVVVQVEAPSAVFKPTKIKLNCSNMDWGDAITLRWYERIQGGGGWVQEDERELEDIQPIPLKPLELEPNRHGTRITLQQTAGTYRVFTWEYLFED